ncbi:acyl-homoserine-lactone synthase [Variovorax paradoxus]|jgi:acyl homoserine lactone synthase|uniref:acyl-homoserine-lactone synthase n=1 Tax=Variovorax paradoxus TaxID=34073 RepID=UPI0029C86047|nr:acyl-homoserine-lactone synthase [Variovorax paradoxus]WPH23866.1 acyl-homoserine-lactone synthase [Variovorax paradoxus]
MEIIAGTIDSFSADVLFDMARYRHEVFVEKLGWKLHTRGRLELDEFDRKDTVYLIARNPDGEIVGTSRLLPTHRPYLLASLFPQLLGDTPAPCSPDIWELSRFAAGDGTRLGMGGDPHGWSLALDMLSAAMRTVAKEGGRRLISASPLGIERILRRTGLCAYRAAPPVRVDGQLLFACLIDVDKNWCPSRDRHADGIGRVARRPAGEGAAATRSVQESET